MPVYYYRAKSDPQNIVEGEIEASSKEAALKKIEDMGYFPVKLEERLAKEAKSKKFLFKRMSPRSLTIFTRQLAILIKAGVPILRALEIISHQTQDSFLKFIVGKIHSDIKEGQSFSMALSKFPTAFSSFYISMVKAGEDSGRVEDTLFRIAGYLKTQREIISKVKIALIYPVIMFLVGIGTVIFMLSFVVPKLMSIFADLGSKLPISTQILISLSNFIKVRWPIIVIVLCIIVFLYMRIRKNKEVKSFLSSLELYIPTVKDFILKKEISRFSRTLELLIKSGIPILKGLKLTIPVLDNEIIKAEFLRSSRDLEDGASLGASLGRSKVFPPFVISLVSIGEESGRLDNTLRELADIYEEELRESTKVFTTLLEPLMILIMGSLVGFIVMAMLLPIFQINMMVK
ncbi:MAG: hypothetical protein B1H08_06730 [Candidatus Omnitrophica bacterium 4484_171]|nr:MAG: hypothetical protein B1H08_06730 [Candidatus Omnitrophica bacterium 4484_171]